MLLAVFWLSAGVVNAYAAGGNSKTNGLPSINSQRDSSQGIPADTTAATDTVASDSLKATTDSAQTSADTTKMPISADTLDAKVAYNARDSIVYDVANGKVYLYGKAYVEHKDITLEAAEIEFNWNTNVVTAVGRKDSTGQMIGQPVFNDGQKQYDARKIRYNFQTEKGKVYEVMTKEGEGYVHGNEVKKTEEDSWYINDAKYTTCNLDHPHFYINAKKMKIIPDKIAVSGPANLVIQDVPTPLYVPFGIFPLQKGQKSGILMPEYGESRQKGFFLKNGGYYFSFNDYIDLQLRGTIYSKGDWGAKAISSYRKRYKYSGSINLKYGRRKSGLPEAPDFSVVNDFRINWRHKQARKANPNSNFSADVNLGTATYDKNFSTESRKVLNNKLTSNISWRRSWRNLPISLNANLRHDQNLRTNRINVTFPQVNFSLDRIHPFQANVQTGEKKWYENISFNYRMDAQNKLSGFDSTFFRQKTLQNANYGIKHNIPIQTSFNLFDHINVNPSINYNERWYFKSIRKEWDPDTTYVKEGDSVVKVIPGQVRTDTVSGFEPARDFSTSISFKTRVYGMARFKKGLIRGFRHVMTPNLSFSYRPDFSNDVWGYYRDVQSSPEGDRQEYSIFEDIGTVYGRPPSGKSGRINFNLSNQIGMKVKDRSDTTKELKKVSLLEDLEISTSYNLAADSLNFDDVSINARTTLFENLRLKANARFNPYAVDSGNRIYDRYMWDKEGKLLRFKNTSISLLGNFRAGQQGSQNTDAGTETERDMVRNNPGDYYDFTIPWSFGFNYTLAIAKGTRSNPDTIDITQLLSLNFDLNLTQNWKISGSSGFDFVDKKLTYTELNLVRNLHCWEIKIRWVPIPKERQTYSIDLGVKSPVLQDLKVSKKQQRFDPAF